MGHTKTNRHPWDLFPRRIRSASGAKAFLPYKAVKHPSSVFNLLFDQPPLSGNRVIYIHIPFCRNNCSFCFYNKCDASDVLKIKEYCTTIAGHIREIASKPWVRSAPFDAVYFGGGTPTSIEPFYLLNILNAIRQFIPLTVNCEITIESSIAGVTMENVSRFVNTGVNRMSLGVQTFDNQLRKSIGRVSDRNRIEEVLTGISREGISNICVDLIYNFPQQAHELWQDDLTALARLPVTGCSVYPLISRNAAEDPQKEFAYFSEADEKLTSMSFWKPFTPVQYGNLNTGTARYVTAHGQSADILAFGAGAAGRINNYMYFHPSDVNLFGHKQPSFNKNLSWMEIDSRFLQLRKIYALSEGLTLSQDDLRPLSTHFSGHTEMLTGTGLAVSLQDRMELTAAGRFWAGNISALFSERINDILKKND